jgi:hypothetical protein
MNWLVGFARLLGTHRSEKAWDESKHPRAASGSERGGEFAKQPAIEYNPEDWESDENEDLLKAAVSIGGVNGVRLVMEPKIPSSLLEYGGFIPGMAYSHGENTIYVYPPAFAYDTSIDLEGQLAHEMMHHYHAVAEGKNRARVQDFWKENGAALQNTRGLTVYSQKVWKAWRDGKVSLHTTIQEELAEMHRIGYDDPKMLSRSVSKPWLRFYKLVKRVAI